ncbi:MAG: F0F1 ATP synthase subunit delta [Gammaproteobacteria bacterium]|nr:F0F1 ATP synthase subunit delta [Gammaproteobacteria bacterium]
MAEKRTVARPYAQAAFALAQEQGELQSWSNMITLLGQAASDPQLKVLLEDPEQEPTKMIGLLQAICGDAMPNSGINMLKLLAENGRLLLLPEIAELFEEERAEVEKCVHANVISATALSDAQQQQLIDALAKRLGKEVTLSHEVDESIIGGAIIHAGDMVIDGSVANRLEKLTNSLVH